MMGKNSQKLPSDVPQEPTKSQISPEEQLGFILQQAGLVSADQVEIALEIQAQQPDLRLGEILALQEWIEPETAKFFVEQWPSLRDRSSHQPLGQYLKQAGLLTEQQIETLLAAQQQSKLKFGELAVSKKWIGQATVDFFLRHLTPTPVGRVNLRQNKEQIGVKKRFELICSRYLQLKPEHDSYPKLLREIFAWTGGQPWLTKKLCQLISKSPSITAGNETVQVARLVTSKILGNWETKEAGEHLNQISDRLLDNQQCEPQQLLELYQKICQQGSILADSSPEQAELLDIGLVIRQGESLVVANRIYQSVFNRGWVAQKLADIMRHSIAETSRMAQSQLTLAINIFKEQETEVKSRHHLWRFLPIALILAGLSLVMLKLAGRHYQLKRSFRAGNELLSRQQYPQAIAKYNELLKIDSNYYQAWTNRGYALASLGQYDKMLESCSAANIIEPQAVYAWNCQGEALHNLQRQAEAVAAFDQAISLDSSDPIFFINKSESLIGLKKYNQSLATIDRAIEALEEIESDEGAAKIRGEFAIALNFKARGLSKKQQYSEAIAAYERALEYQPDYFPAQIGKGIARYKLEQYTAASNEFEEILENIQLTKSQKAATWFYLGKTLCKSSRLEESTIAFESALKLQPDYEAAKSAQKSCR